MIKLNSQFANKPKNQRQINFTFANPKIKSKTLEPNASEFTSSQKRALGMWLETVLQVHSQQFVHALKSCRKYSIVALSQYIKKHYSHLKIIAQYYIIASFLDYELIISQANVSLEKQCVFTNIVIQELTSRFFRESQWYHKIGYLPIFTVFPLFDSFSKGYTTILQLKNALRKKLLLNSTIKPINNTNQKFVRKKEKLLFLKLSNNIQGKDSKIYQQNIQELMFRVNLVLFEEKTEMGSKRYMRIKEILDQHEQIITERYERSLQQEIIKEIKDKEELQIMRENFQITFKSNLLTRANDSAQNKDSARKIQEKIPQSAFSTMPYSTTFTAPRHQNLERINLNEDLRRYSNNQLLNRKAKDQKVRMRVIEQASEHMKQNAIFQQNLLHKEFVSQNLKQIQRNKVNLQYRDSILKQLDLIRQEKRSNHSRLLNYI